MANKKIVILDGCGVHDQDLDPVLDELSDVLSQDGSQLETFPLRAMNLAHCLGCFGCWLKTPGMCVEDDEGRKVARAIIQSDATVFFTPVTFGGYSPDLKKMMDHFIQLISPYFQLECGEVHHLPRYARRPRLMMVGVQRHANAHEAYIFKTLAGRNALNFHAPSYAAEVVATADPDDTRRGRFEALLARSDTLPFGEAAASLMPPPMMTGVAGVADSTRRALLIVGSPKTTCPSTSSVLGSYLLDRLAKLGWETESLTLRASLTREEGEAALLEASDRAGLILLVFPLYADALPFLVTKALTVMAAHRQAATHAAPKRLVAIVNSGFPEIRQNSVALGICEAFASGSGMLWEGGLALGGGGVVGGQPLTEKKRSGLPVKHVISALDLTAAALEDGRPVPAAAAILMAKNPVPLIPFALSRWIYIRFGGKGFEQEAAKNGISRERMLEQPYAA
jgi:multimeric flavodoxin WrbA